MNLYLEQFLNDQNIHFERLEKKQKVKLLARWTKAFPQLVRSVPHTNEQEYLQDAEAENTLSQISLTVGYYILPDDQSAMPSYQCSSVTLPHLNELVSDTITKCDRIIIVDEDFQWSFVLENGGSPQMVGIYFADTNDQS